MTQPGGQGEKEYLSSILIKVLIAIVCKEGVRKSRNRCATKEAKECVEECIVNQRCVAGMVVVTEDQKVRVSALSHKQIRSMI